MGILVDFETLKCEAFHNAMNKSVTNTHPSIWKLLDALKNEESLAAFKMAQYRAKGKEALLRTLRKETTMTELKI